jgi:hypothetical protein
VDQDGDVDVLTASEVTNAIIWWESDGTPGNGGWTEHIIQGDFGYARAVFAVDLDLDNDLDILGAAGEEENILWWENDGTPKDGGWIPHLINSEFLWARDVNATDLDNDGYMDVIGTSAEYGKMIVWWENDGSPGDDDWIEHVIIEGIVKWEGASTSVNAADVNQDGFKDIIGAVHDANQVIWWENNGAKQFTQHNVGDLYFAYDVDAADFNGDNAIDIVGISPFAYYDARIILFENQPEYRISVKQSNYWVAAWPDYKASDATIEVDVRNPSEVFGSYGLTFGLDENLDQLYTFEITPDGQFILWRFDPSSGWVVLYYGSSAAIHPGAATNHLKIERNGEAITAFANDQLLASIQEGSFKGLSRVGVTASTYSQFGLDLRFDNFIVYPIQCAPSSFDSVESNGNLPIPLGNWEIRPNEREGVDPIQ